MNKHSAKFEKISDFKKFFLAGNSVFTLVSKRTGARFTYRVRQPGKANSPHFISFLFGPDNTKDFIFFGYIKNHDVSTFSIGKKTVYTPDTPVVKGFRWLLHNLDNEALFDQVEIWHSGKCGKCGRALTVPESIATGLGPVCEKSLNQY